MAEFKFTSISITKISDDDNLFQIIFDNSSQSFLLDYTAHVNKNDLTIYDNVINKQYVFNYTSVKARANEIDNYLNFTTSKEMFLYLFNLGFFNKRCCGDNNVDPNVIISSDESIETVPTLDGYDLKTNLLKLPDTPDDYTGDANKLLKVKADETGVDFIVDDSIKNVKIGTTNLPIAVDKSITIPPASQTQTGLITATSDDSIQEFKGRKEIFLPNIGDLNGFGFQINSASGTPAFKVTKNGDAIFSRVTYFGTQVRLDGPSVFGPSSFPMYGTLGFDQTNICGIRTLFSPINNHATITFGRISTINALILDGITGNVSVGKNNLDTSDMTEKFEVFFDAGSPKGSIPFPRVTHAQRTNVSFVPSKTGTHVYQTDSNGLSSEGVYVWKSVNGDGLAPFHWVFAY